MKNIFLLIYVSLLSLSCFSQVNINQGLMAYYPFNGNDNDASGNKNNPVFNNARLTNDRFGNPNSAYHFNGINNYMKVRDNPSLNMTDKMSISLWVKPTGYYRGSCYNNMLLMKGDGDYLDGNYSVRFADAYTGCTHGNTAKEFFYGVPGIVAPAPLVQLNQWYNVVWTCDGNMIKIYVDCVLRANILQGKATFTNPYDLFIGHMNNDQYPYWLNGDLDEIRIYNRALSRDEVMELCKKDPVPAPAADFTYTISNCNKVNFKISKAENINTFKWDFGDKTIVGKEFFTHSYHEAGNYNVRLIGTGTNGKEIIISKTITITKQSVAFSYEKTPDNNRFIFTIDNKEKLKYKWLFGDGETNDKEKKITHIYKEPGNYNVLLIAENKIGCIDTAMQTITIAAPQQQHPVTTANTTPPANSEVVLEQRQNDLLKEIEVSSDSLSVSFYDNGIIDGDSVTIVYNKKVIATHLFLTDKPVNFMLPVDKTGRSNELIMYAENLGSIPPNTALMVVYDGDKRHEINISSSKTSNGMVSFIFKR